MFDLDPTITDYDVNFWTNSWINYTRTFPAGNYYLYGRMAAASAFSMQCAVVTNGWGTETPEAEYLGTFIGTGTSFANWQWVQLVNTNTGLPVIVSLAGTNTLQMTGDYKENVNFFQLVPVAPQSVNLSAALNGANVQLSFPTQAGFNYSIEYKDNLADAVWMSLPGSVLGDGSAKMIVDTNGNSTRFYRLKIQ
jgi:hypothetical protein